MKLLIIQQTFKNGRSILKCVEVLTKLPEDFEDEYDRRAWEDYLADKFGKLFQKQIFFINKNSAGRFKKIFDEPIII